MLGVPVDKVEDFVVKHKAGEPYPLIERYDDEIRKVQERLQKYASTPPAMLATHNEMLRGEVASLKQEVDMLRDLITELGAPYEKASIFFAQNLQAAEGGVSFDREKTLRLHKMATLCGTKKTR